MRAEARERVRRCEEIRVCPALVAVSPERCVKRPMPATQSPTASTQGLLVCSVSLICTPSAEHVRCACGAHAVRMRCACGAHAVHMQCLCLHAISRVGHARLFETEALHVGPAPGGDQQH
eukprot:scaffold99323_cov81-Phaeocystis_antarctica.AAC.1